MIPYYLFKVIFDFVIACNHDCVAAIERLYVLHYSVKFIFLSFWIKDYIAEVYNYKRVTDKA